ncbi:hypothetical protein SAMN05421740_1092 [Parapedobacter koreensis]|uniref:Uncharacterized protein n=1 Tax=Parapedobacter koreensis TaxID=332977 RepID=A0A1H7SI91_9SPHI|nr:hypothetical protein SAMN05421740_1092 [Parapedobacter koreensis]
MAAAIDAGQRRCHHWGRGAVMQLRICRGLNIKMLREAPVNFSSVGDDNESHLIRLSGFDANTVITDLNSVIGFITF